MSSEGSRQNSIESINTDSPPLSAPAAPAATATHSPAPASATSDSRFFKFRFTSTSSSRPSSPGVAQSPNLGNGPPPLHHHLTSPSMPTLPSAHMAKELEELNAKFEKECAARKTISREKEALEAEIESLSQALFEEVSTLSLIVLIQNSISSPYRPTKWSPQSE